MNLVPDLKNTLFNDNVKDIALDFSEMGIDAAINNDILAEVPIAKSIVAFCKTGAAIRDRNLLKQTLKFIDEFRKNTISSEKVEAYKRKMDNSKFAEKELSRVIYLLDCNIDTIKSGVLARMYASYIDGNINWSVFCELSDLNSRVFITDYKALVAMDECDIDHYIVERLIGYGLMMEIESPSKVSTINDIFSGMRNKKDPNIAFDLNREPCVIMTEFGKLVRSFLDSNMFKDSED
jgi:hypothetical protein